MSTSLIALLLWSTSPSVAEPHRVDDEARARDVASLLAEITAAAARSPARARSCADARSATRDAALPEVDLEKFRAQCPSWFPVPAAPDFCRTRGCATDFAWVR